MQNRRTLLAVSALAPVFAAQGDRTRRAAAQAATPTGPPDAVVRDTAVVYGQADGQELLLDVYRPPVRDQPRPAVVLLHGGAWMVGTADRTSMNGPARALAEADGYVTFNVDYRLTGDPAGEHRWPAQLDDVQRAVRWVRANADRYGVDPSRIGAYGHSAGGHLAAMLGVRETRDNDDPALEGYSSRVNAVVTIAGQMDLGLPYPEAFDRLALVALLGGTPDEVPDAYQDASPMTWVDAESAPFLLIHGGADPSIPVAHARQMADALHGAEVAVVAVELPTGDHFSVAQWAIAGPWTRTFFAVTLQPEH